MNVEISYPIPAVSPLPVQDPGSLVAGPVAFYMRHSTLLFRLDARRLAHSLRRPTGAWIGVGLPAGLLVGLLWAVGGVTTPRVEEVEGAVTLGFLVAGPLAFAAYGILFGGADSAFLRRTEIPAVDLYRERAARLLALSLGGVGLVLLPFLSAGVPLARPFALALATALATWGAGLAAVAGAARAVSRHRPGEGWGLLALGMWDTELASIAPLVHAPLLPLFAGGAAAGLVGAAPGAGWGRLTAVAAASLAAAVLAGRWYAAGLPRFAPRALEMTFVAPPPEGGALVVGRGAALLLPRKAAAVWARDAVTAGRRFAWAGRIAWLVAIAALVGLARWGESPAAREWIAAAASLALLAQGAAGIGLGRLERGGRRWIDRSLGIGWPHRLLGRWSWGTGLSLWLTLPLALAWSWWSGAGPGWPWLLAGAGIALVSAAGSLTVSGWR